MFVSLMSGSGSFKVTFQSASLAMKQTTLIHCWAILILPQHCETLASLPSSKILPNIFVSTLTVTRVKRKNASSQWPFLVCLDSTGNTIFGSPLWRNYWLTTIKISKLTNRPFAGSSAYTSYITIVHVPVTIFALLSQKLAETLRSVA